jgi:hypothetical protein
MRSVPVRLARAATTAVLPALALLALAGCGGDSGGTSSSPSPSADATPSTVTISAPTTSASSTPAADVTATITIAGGKVTGGIQTINAKAGQTIMITATSDATEEVHIHGYDKELELTPGKPASVTFTADTKGSFEIESHKTDKLLAKLVVS